MFAKDMHVAGYDDELAQAIAAERQRQEDHVELIASENYASPRVLEAQGSVLTNKYAEGYPGKRSTVAANTSTSPRISRSSASSGCSEPITPTCSRTRVPKRTPPSISR